ncbi:MULTISPECIES: hypothetical protein [unclassified Streptomyces]|uniref:hypothetical protein n=1 Tax=unclassified Streptomyces TaxID=2593676 RepID=UPI0004C8BD15|nr:MULTISPECIES: hypothetical protein [unclassified Streptomyces]KOV72438.1 hypothetical protein ADL02_43355 [Streptomyces sp. NRRL WC-3723]
MDNETDRPHSAAGPSGTARAPRRTRRVRAAILTTALLTAGAALTACGGGGGSSSTDGGQKSDSGIASLATPSSDGGKPGAPSSARSSTAAVDAKRPQLRLDSSKEEINRFWDTYWACLQAHGVPMNTKRVDHPGGQAPPLDDQKVTDEYKAQYHACLNKMPLQPVEERPETNPHYADDFRAYVKCLRSKGFEVHEVFASDGSPDGWTGDDGGGGLPNEKADNDCRMEAFGGKGKN